MIGGAMRQAVFCFVIEFDREGDQDLGQKGGKRLRIRRHGEEPASLALFAIEHVAHRVAARGVQLGVAAGKA